MRRFPVLLAALLLLAASTPVRALEALEARTRSFRLLTDGSRAYEEGRYAEAAAMLQEVTEISLNSFQGYYYLGLSYNHLRRYTEAVRSLQIALELEPDHLQSHIGLGDAYLKQGDLHDASVAYNRALELQPTYAPAFDGLARMAESQGKDDEAERTFRRAIEANPGYPEPYLHLGDLYFRRGKVSQAVDLFLQAIQVRPDFGDAFNALGTAYAEQGLYDEAMAAIAKARALRPYDARHPLALGKVLFSLGLRDRAEEEYHEALRLDPDLLETYLRLGELFRAERHYDDARAILMDGLARDVDEPLLRAEMQRRLEQYGLEKARLAALETRADTGEPLTVDEALLLARLYAELDDAEKAAQVLDRAIGDQRVEITVRFEQGYYWLRARRYEEALQAFSFLAEIDPRDTAALVNLGIAASALGNLMRAEEAYQKALRVDPRLADAYLYLGNLYVRSGRKTDATNAYRQYLQVQDDGEWVERVRRILEMLGEQVEG